MKLVTRRELDEHEITLLESYLGKTLHEVTPRTEYVSGLRDRLLEKDLPKAVVRAQQLRRYMPLIVAGVLGGVVLLLTGLRLMISWLSSGGETQHRSAGLQEAMH